RMPLVRSQPPELRARAEWTAPGLLSRVQRVRIPPRALVHAGPVDQWLSRRPLKAENRDRYPAGAHESRSSRWQGCRTFISRTRVGVPQATQARGVGPQPPLRTAASEVRLLARARHRWRQRAAASHKRGAVRAALTTGTRASSNGRAAVLQTADGGSIPSART